MENAQPIYPDVTLRTSKGPLKPIKGDHRYFEFSQNNSGGHFYRNDDLGDHVIIAARDYEDANDRLQLLGGYFDGYSSGNDCSCCGDRWYPAGSYDEGSETPLVAGCLSIPEFITNYRWPGRKVIVYHADGYRDTYTLTGDDSTDDDGLA